MKLLEVVRQAPGLVHHADLSYLRRQRQGVYQYFFDPVDRAVKNFDYCVVDALVYDVEDEEIF